MSTLEEKSLESDPVSSSEEKGAYAFNEAVMASTEYFGGDTLAAEKFVEKYALKDSDGNIYESTPDEMHWRIANEVNRIEVERGYPNPLPAEKVYSLLKDFKYIIPQGSPMAGIGNDQQVVSLSNCFVIGNESDSYGGIMLTDQEQIQLMKRRGGVGHDLSNLRPAEAPVNNSALTSTGAVSFMERYSNSTREVAQEGRRGALMLSLSIRHPDAEGFVDSKMDTGKITGANISLRIDDEFMEAVEEGRNYTQKFPIDSDNPRVEREINASKLWDKLIHNAWASAEPGILFWDTIKRESVPDSYADLGFETISTNPCGEIPLSPYDSCRLLAMNLSSYVENPFTEEARFDKELFEEHVYYAQRIADDIIDLEVEKIDAILEKIEKDPEPENVKAVEKNLWEKIRDRAVRGRRTGTGITAEGDMLASLGIRYGSEESIEFSSEVHKTMALGAYKASVELAKERGPFEIYDFEREEGNPFINRLIEADPELEEGLKKHGRRNIGLLTIAPTGTVSLMAQTTSGLENLFKPMYTRRTKITSKNKEASVDFEDEVGDKWENHTVFHHKFADWLEMNDYDIEEVRELDENSEEFREIFEQSPYAGATSEDVDWIQKVKLQGAVQKWVDHSISVTINIPEDTSEETVDELYRTAWKEGCKGATIYRAGSRSGVLISSEDAQDDVSRKELSDLVMKQLDRPRPENVIGRTEKVDTPFGSGFLTFNREGQNGKLPYEVFLSVGKAGGDITAITEGYGRLISLALKAGIPPEYLVDQLKDIGGETQTGLGPGKVKSLPDAIAKGVKIILEKDGKSIDEDVPQKKISGNLCPECGNSLTPSDGCEKCLHCGFEKCG